MAPRSRSFSNLKGESQKGLQESKQIPENHILSQARARVLSLSHAHTHPCEANIYLLFKTQLICHHLSTASPLKHPQPLLPETLCSRYLAQFYSLCLYCFLHHAVTFWWGSVPVGTIHLSMLPDTQ